MVFIFFSPKIQGCAQESKDYDFMPMGDREWTIMDILECQKY
jgi:hypothetical protein